jgi:hypothetical protein
MCYCKSSIDHEEKVLESNWPKTKEHHMQSRPRKFSTSMGQNLLSLAGVFFCLPSTPVTGMAQQLGITYLRPSNSSTGILTKIQAPFTGVSH